MKPFTNRVLFAIAAFGMILFTPSAALAGPYPRDVFGLFGLFAVFYFLPVHILVVTLAKTFVWEYLAESKSVFFSTMKTILFSLILQILWILISGILMIGGVMLISLFTNALKETGLGFVPWVVFFLSLDFLDYSHSVWLYTKLQKKGFSKPKNPMALYASPLLGLIAQVCLSIFFLKSK